MIELFYASTPNGRKISIMLEEIKFDYKITEIIFLREINLNLILEKLVLSAKYQQSLITKIKLVFFSREPF